MSASVKIDPFVNGVRYVIPYGPGVAWEMGSSPSFVPEKSCYVYSIDAPRASNTNPNPTAQIDVRPMSVLTLKPAECGGDCPLQQHGSASIENAKRYYLGPTATRENAELVGVSAGAAPGHVLKGLKISGGGRVYWWPRGNELEDFSEVTSDMIPVDSENDLYTDSDLLVEMTSDVTLTPVFNVNKPYAVVFGGAFSYPPTPNAEPPYDSGLFGWAPDPSKYDVHMYNEDAADENGDGDAFDDLVDAIESSDWPLRIVIAGHSHGGGSVQSLCARLAQAVADEALIANFSIILTVYVDAIMKDSSGPINIGTETRYPEGSLYHVNLFETISFPPRGGSVPGSDVNLNVNDLSCVDGVGHQGIDDCEVVLRIMTNQLESRSFCEAIDSDYCNDGIACLN